MRHTVDCAMHSLHVVVKLFLLCTVDDQIFVRCANVENQQLNHQTSALLRFLSVVILCVSFVNILHMAGQCHARSVPNIDTNEVVVFAKNVR